VPVGLRRRAPSSRRDRAHPKAHRRGEPAALQRHADRRVRTARRRARTGRRGQRLRGRVARVLDRPGRPRTRADRQAGPRDAGAGRWRAACRPRAGTLTTTCSVAVEPRTARSGTRDPTMASRREFFRGATAVTGAVAAASVAKAAMAALPEPVVRTEPGTMSPLAPSTGRPYRPVVTLNGWTLPWRMNRGVKEFHLVAEPVVREMAPGFKAHLWGYNGQSPGPTIDVVQGDRVRSFVTNRLPEHTSTHWHGQRLPNGMDGVNGLTQKGIDPGKTFVYEFVARRPGTFMYHPHADEMTQMAMGMMGFWVTHPTGRQPLIDDVDRDFVFLLNAYDIDPGSYTPKIMTMLDFNLWSWNSRIFPGIDPLVVRKNDRVRIRIGNLTMTNHPIHLHGHEFVVTGTD